jgi:hypothetical protein
MSDNGLADLLTRDRVPDSQGAVKAASRQQGRAVVAREGGDNMHPNEQCCIMRSVDPLVLVRATLGIEHCA